MRERYQECGYNGLFDQRRRKRSILRVPTEQAERVLALYQETYLDLSVKHFHEKLQEEHAVELSYTWAKQALQGAGLVNRRKSAARIAFGGHVGQYQGCCCTSMAVSIAGSPTTAIRI